MPPAEFEPTIPGSERPQTHASDRATSGIGLFVTLNSVRTFSRMLLIVRLIKKNISVMVLFCAFTVILGR